MKALPGISFKQILESITDNLEEIEEEFMVLRDLSKHPNLPEFHGIFLRRGKNAKNIEEDQLWFVMELCTGGSITDLVHELRLKNSRLNDNQIAYILRETIQALIHLHENHCMHRDIKGHNILLTEQGNVKLVDFGVSSNLAATLARRNTSVGTPFWMSNLMTFIKVKSFVKMNIFRSGSYCLRAAVGPKLRLEM